MKKHNLNFISIYIFLFFLEVITELKNLKYNSIIHFDVRREFAKIK